MKGGILDLGELLEAVSQEPKSNSMEKLARDEERRANRYSTEDAIMMLRNAKAVLDQDHTFQPGDIVRYKKGLMYGHKTPCGGVAIFLRYGKCPFPEALPDTGNPLGLYDCDCILGVLLPNGAMAEYMGCSRYLEPPA